MTLLYGNCGKKLHCTTLFLFFQHSCPGLLPLFTLFEAFQTIFFLGRQYSFLGASLLHMLDILCSPFF